ncbi:hypothetical protein EJ04DRAFT_570888 [Polyplosphaeria fusca]|uniref:Uncharacterized protein n=1 Tax=Polyplosphaeria fusca TaxID=682080 RepID=A0A9P4QIF7_9PLEO|nr:hypothetical protein EJ04DRAFT_570888 [Polyplosphaeria fusca]
MELIDRDIFHRAEGAFALSLLDFKPAVVTVLEIDHLKNRPPIFRRLFLAPVEFDHWIAEQSHSKCGSRPSEVIGRLRLVLAPKFPTSDQKYGHLATHHDRFPADHVPEHLPLPFSRKQFELLSDHLELPSALPALLAKEFSTSSESHFQVYDSAHREKTTSAPPVICNGQTDDCVDTLKLTMRVKGWSMFGVGTCLALSHSRTTNTTNALLVCKGPEQATYVCNAIERVSSLSTHPALIPCVLCNCSLDVVDEKVDVTWVELFLVELDSGQTGVSLVSDGALLEPRDCSDPNISKRATGVSQRALAWGIYADLVNSLIAEVADFVASYGTGLADTDLIALRVEQGQIIKDQVSLISQRGRSLRRRIEHLRGRAEVQVTTIYNHLAQQSNQINLHLAESSRKVAVEAQKDAATMKSVAVLTMTFLPATFIATLFATPAMMSSSPSQGTYWAVTIPLTALVLIIWSGWTWTSMRQIEKTVAPVLTSRDLDTKS